MTDPGTSGAQGADPAAPLPQWPAPQAEPEQLLAAILAYLHTLPPLARARAAKLLAEADARARFGAVRRGAIYQATRSPDATYDTVAAALGVSWSAVNKAVNAHNHPNSAA